MQVNVFSVLREIKGKKRISLLEIVLYFLICVCVCVCVSMRARIDVLNSRINAIAESCSF